MVLDIWHFWVGTLVSELGLSNVGVGTLTVERLLSTYCFGTLETVPLELWLGTFVWELAE